VLLYALAAGWTVEAKTIDIPQGHLLVWDGHLWHAGGELVEGSVNTNIAWWGRLEENKGGGVYCARAVGKLSTKRDDASSERSSRATKRGEWKTT
jgi:hypothetical protein